MAAASGSELQTLMAHVEELWRGFDVLFAAIEAEDRWSQRHGADWVFADLPYHLAYCEREIVARPVALGRELPEEDQWEARSISELNAWNAREFAKRPADQTVDRSLEQMRASRDAVRQATSGMTDADFDRPAWFPLVWGRGWQTARNPLYFCRQHAWNEFMQLRIHLDREAPEPSRELTEIALGGYISFFPFLLDQRAATGTSFKAVMDFTKSDVGPWTLAIDDGKAEMVPGRPEDADLVITQDAASFVKTWNQMWDPAEGIQSGRVEVSDFDALKTFGALFPPPDPDRVF